MHKSFSIVFFSQQVAGSVEVFRTSSSFHTSDLNTWATHVNVSVVLPVLDLGAHF